MNLYEFLSINIWCALVLVSTIADVYSVHVCKRPDLYKFYIQHVFLVSYYVSWIFPFIIYHSMSEKQYNSE